MTTKTTKDGGEARPPTLAERVLAIASEAGALEKRGKADPKVGGFLYHKIDDVEEHLRGLLAKHGVAVYPTLAEYSTTTFNNRSGNSTWLVEALVDVELVAADTGESKTIRALGHGMDTGDKSPGKAMSYAIKSAYLSLFHLKGQPDSDGDHHDIPAATKPAAAPRPTVDRVEVNVEPLGVTGAIPPEAWAEIASSWHGRDRVTPAQRKRLFAIAESSGWRVDEIKTALEHHLGLRSTSDLADGGPYEKLCALFGAFEPDHATTEEEER